MRVRRFYISFFSIIVILVLFVSIIPISSAQIVAPTFQYNSPSEYQKATGKRITKFNESPMLADLVKAGKLPPVEKRLPVKPLVVVPVEKVGQYGGTWRRLYIGPADLMNFYTLTSGSLLKFNREDPSILEPNLAESWQISPDGKTIIIKLRTGVKWSDGRLFTADDVMFWYNDIILNKELTPTPPGWLVVGGKVGKIEKLGTYTVSFTFSKAYPLILNHLANTTCFAPKHYLKQFHPGYTSKTKLDATIKGSGFQFWYQLFQSKASRGLNPDLPVVDPWKIVVPPGVGTRMVAERNPYYWKIDIAGNQLPYIDRVVFDFVENVEILNFKAITGEADIQFRHIQLKNYPLFVEEGKKKGYHLYVWRSGGTTGFHINQNNKDPILRKIVQDKRFRQALSLAINREEINSLLYQGLAKPKSACPIKGSMLYSEKWARSYIEYDPEKANKLLDEMGLDKRDKDGFRLRPDGKTLMITIENPGLGTYPDECELVKEYWRKIGIKAEAKSIERSLYTVRQQAGEQDVSVWGTGYLDQINPLLFPEGWVPLSANCSWAPLWGIWYATGGKGGEEPPQEIKTLISWVEEVTTTIDAKRREELITKITDWYADNVPIVTTVGEFPVIGVVRDNYKNVPKESIWDVLLGQLGYVNPEQFFIETK